MAPLYLFFASGRAFRKGITYSECNIRVQKNGIENEYVVSIKSVISVVN